MHYLKPDPIPKWMFSCVGLVYFQSLFGLRLTASGLSYGLGLSGEEKIMETGILLLKMDIAHFIHTSKPGNFNILREVIWIIFWHCYLEIEWRWEVVPKKIYGYNIRQMICTGHVLEAPGLYQQILL